MKNKKITLPLALFTIAVLLFFYFYHYETAKRTKLQQGAFESYATLEKLKENSRDGKTDKVDLIYFYFVKNDTVFHKLKRMPAEFVKKKRLKQNETYKIRVADTDYSVFKIDFKERVDTTILKQNYTTQIYDSFIHKNILE